MMKELSFRGALGTGIPGPRAGGALGIACRADIVQQEVVGITSSAGIG